MVLTAHKVLRVFKEIKVQSASLVLPEQLALTAHKVLKAFKELKDHSA